MSRVSAMELNGIDFESYIGLDTILYCEKNIL